jgi:peroxin-11B
VRWNALKSHLALARKRTPPFHNVPFGYVLTPCSVLRLGKPLEHLQAALRAAQSTGDLKEQLTTIARQLGYFGYLAYDAVVWVCAKTLTHNQYMINVLPQVNAIKFISLKPETSQKVQKISNRFWLAGILFSLTHGILKVSFQHVFRYDMSSWYQFILVGRQAA